MGFVNEGQEAVICNVSLMRYEFERGLTMHSLKIPSNQLPKFKLSIQYLL